MRRAIETSTTINLALLDDKKNENIDSINSTSVEQLSILKGLTAGFQVITGNPFELQEVLSNSDLEIWLVNTDNQAKFNKILSNPHSVLTIIGHSSALGKIVNSPLAMQALAKSRIALSIIANFAFTLHMLVGSEEAMRTIITSPTAMNVIADSSTAMNAIAGSSTARDIIRNSSTAIGIVGSNSMAIAKLACGLAGLSTANYADMNEVTASVSAMNAIATSSAAINTIANSSAAMNTIVGSAVALKAIIKSELACRAIETNIQSHRLKVIETLNSSSSFRKQSGITVGEGSNAIREHGANSSTIYVPILCNDDNDTDFHINSLLTGSRLASISRHSGDVTVTSGITLRGVQVQGSGGSAGTVIFDIYTAV